MSEARIGLLDSGVGGLSVYQVVRARVPDAVFHYCSDNLHFPYGIRAEDDVIRCVLGVALPFVERCRLDMLIVACNTMSTVALPALRSALHIPVVGVVPAIKPAAAATRTQRLGLVATPGTVARRYTHELIAEFAPHCDVVLVGSSRLVEEAERKLRGEPVDGAAVEGEIAALFAKDATDPARRLDVAVLGCTHFPLLLPELEAASAWPLRWLDSSGAIAARVAYLLSERTPRLEHPALEVPRAAADAPRAWFTEAGPAVEALRPALARLGFAGAGIL